MPRKHSKKNFMPLEYFVDERHKLRINLYNIDSIPSSKKQQQHLKVKSSQKFMGMPVSLEEQDAIEHASKRMQILQNLQKEKSEELRPISYDEDDTDCIVPMTMGTKLRDFEVDLKQWEMSAIQNAIENPKPHCGYCFQEYDHSQIKSENWISSFQQKVKETPKFDPIYFGRCKDCHEYLWLSRYLFKAGLTKNGNRKCTLCIKIYSLDFSKLGSVNLETCAGTEKNDKCGLCSWCASNEILKNPTSEDVILTSFEFAKHEDRKLIAKDFGHLFSQRSSKVGPKVLALCEKNGLSIKSKF